MERVEEAFDRAMQALLGLHRDFDLGDEMILADHATVEGDEVVVERARYKMAIVPATINLESSTVDLIEKFIAGGGRVVWLSTPGLEPCGLVGGEPSGRPGALERDPRSFRAGLDERDLAETLDGALPRRVSVVSAETGREASQVLCHQRVADGAGLFFLANTDRDAGISLKVRVTGEGRWERWDCETGEVRETPSVQSGAGSEVTLDLAPVGSALLRFNPQQVPAYAVERDPARMEKIMLSPKDGWAFERLAPNSLILDRCRYRINDEPLSGEMFLMDAQEEWRARFGLFSARTINAEKQPWLLREEPANLKAVARVTLEYAFTVRDVPTAKTWLVLEDRDQTAISVNGSPIAAHAAGWFMDRSFERVPVGSCLKEGENVIRLSADLTAMRMMEDVYIIGDFGVAVDDHAIVAEPQTLRTGDWCPQGYPFYTDGMLYKATLDVPGDAAGRVSVALDGFEGTVAAVHVNGAKAGVIGWRPYEVDVTDAVRPGANEIGIEIVGSPRNLMGPRHTAEKYPAWVGAAEVASTETPRYHLSPAGLLGNVTAVLTAG